MGSTARPVKRRAAQPPVCREAGVGVFGQLAVLVHLRGHQHQVGGMDGAVSELDGAALMDRTDLCVAEHADPGRRSMSWSE
jgi:hypothetical protein